MMLPLLYAAMGGSAYVTSGKLQQGAAENNMQFKEIMGIEQPKFFGGLGLAGLIFGGPLVAAVGAGLLLGSIEANRTIVTVREGVADYLTKEAARQAALQQGGAPQQLPGGATPPLGLPGAGTPPANASLWDMPGKFLDWILPGSPAPTTP